MLTYLASKIDTYSAPPKTVFIWARQFVITFTVSLARVISPSSPYKVLFVGNKFQMVGVAAASVLADYMVNYEGIIQRPNKPCVDKSMSQKRYIRQISNGHFPVTIDISSPLPFPATTIHNLYITYNTSNSVRL